MKFFPFCTFILGLLLSMSTLQARSPFHTADDWIDMGATHGPAPNFDLYYYKLLQLNNSGNRYSTMLELSIQGDDSGFDKQGTYQLRVNKIGTTTDRFNGLEIRCLSGNAQAATFYVYKDAVWVRSNFKWGRIYYRITANFGATAPISAAPFGQTLTEPQGYATMTNSFGLKCDFITNQYYQLSYEDVKGNVNVKGKIGAGIEPAYTLHSAANNNPGAASALLWGQYVGAIVGTSNAPASAYAFSVTNNINADGTAASGGLKHLFYVRGDGNVGIGTSQPKAKLAVNGDIFAHRLKITLSDWPDFVFEKNYALPSLQELEQFIAENKHLPGIPSEKEVLRDGLDVGALNSRLLQKIEELTLYIIELRKESENQAKRINQLEMLRSGR
ncbi:hypothetical protein [Chitinophaga qingshengii]|uniref:Uncharacterized protein n=1 Tax=Chitinophaga qingshengii TaxID=1569794 RepID=A0ABR7TWR5_9BACT|nr:hypothetical protein [Chitinophaga qingshengii]MBC9934877.1 hypothetical protein [Chitinophaga qingshengii]